RTPCPIVAIGHFERWTRADEPAIALHSPGAPAVCPLPSRSRHRTGRVAADASRRDWRLLSRNRSPAFDTGASHGGCRDALFIQDHTRCLRWLVATAGRDRGDAVPVRNDRTRARTRITLQRIVAWRRGSVVDPHRSSTAHVLCR